MQGALARAVKWWTGLKWLLFHVRYEYNSDLQPLNIG